MILARKIACMLSLLCVFAATAANADEFSETAAQLSQGSYGDKIKTIDALSAIDDERVLPTLTAMLDARLFTRKSDDLLVILDKSGKDTLASAVLSGESLGVINEKEFKKIRINNRVRRALRPQIAMLQLVSEDESVRLQSAKDLTKNPDASMRQVIADAYVDEKSGKVRSTLGIALAMIDIEQKDPVVRLAAVETLSKSLDPEVVAILKGLAARDDDGAFTDADPAVAELAEEKLKSVEAKVSFYKFTENIVFGFSLGSILLLAAIGLAITFGVMGVINMAHGEMIMLGAYTTFAIQQIFPQLIDWSLLMAIPAAFLVSGCAGVLIERLVIRHLYGRPLDTLLATFGISLILQQAVRMYDSNNVAVITPEWLAGFWQVNGAMALTYNRLYILIFSLLVLGALALVLKKTMMGLQMRAVTQNRAMANSMGIRSSWVDALTFGLGSGIAGIAGVALSQITNVGPNLGQAYIIDSFMVVVFGGVGNLLGTFFGAMSLGVANKLLEPYAGAVVGKIIVLVFIILFIQWRPRGLFALKGRFVED